MSRVRQDGRRTTFKPLRVTATASAREGGFWGRPLMGVSPLVGGCLSAREKEERGDAAVSRALRPPKPSARPLDGRCALAVSAGEGEGCSQSGVDLLEIGS